MHSADGGYHSRIHSAGYRHPESIKAWVGFPATFGAAVKCDIFPKRVDIASQHSSFFTLSQNVYTKENKDFADNSYHLCTLSQPNCDRKSVGNTVFHFRNTVPKFHTIPGAPSPDCADLAKTDVKDYTHTCNTYLYAVISKTPSKHYFLTTDQTGKICAGEEGNGWKIQK